MPTGYTCYIFEGMDITPKEYIMKCSRAFGALIEMKDKPLDSPIPEELKPDDYHPRQIEKIKKEIEKVKEEEQQKTQAQKERDYIRDYSKAYNEWQKSQDDMKAMENRYQDMIDKVSKWIPPTPDHENLKKFALNQLIDSKEFDVHYSEFCFPSKEDYFNSTSKIKDLEWDLEYHEKEYQKEIESCKKANMWLQQLRDSLKDF